VGWDAGFTNREFGLEISNIAGYNQILFGNHHKME
jgi:hypothetical protein